MSRFPMRAARSPLSANDADLTSHPAPMPATRADRAVERGPKVLIADDHKVVTEGLVRLLSDRFEIVGTIADGRLVVDAVARLRPDIILLDLSMPNVSGLEVMRQLREQRIAARAIVLTMHADADLAVEALKA